VIAEMVTGLDRGVKVGPVKKGTCLIQGDQNCEGVRKGSSRYKWGAPIDRL